MKAEVLVEEEEEEIEEAVVAFGVVWAVDPSKTVEE